jgi:hypothetical protein
VTGTRGGSVAGFSFPADGNARAPPRATAMRAKKFAHFRAIGLVRRANASRRSRSHHPHGLRRVVVMRMRDAFANFRVDAHRHIGEIAASRANACVQESRMMSCMRACMRPAFAADASRARARNQRRALGENNLRQVVDS